MHYQKLAALTDFDFDAMYDASTHYVDRNMYWPVGLDAAGKKEYMRARLSKYLESPIALGFVLKDGDSERALTIGLLDKGNFHVTAGLSLPDETGSRAYLYSPEQSARWREFLLGEGVTRIILTMAIGSSLANVFQQRYANCGPPVVVDGHWRQEFNLTGAGV